MPIPNRKAGEPRDEFISRCISQISDEYDIKQASAICYAQLHSSFSNQNQAPSLNAEIVKKYEKGESGVL